MNIYKVNLIRSILWSQFVNIYRKKKVYTKFCHVYYMTMHDYDDPWRFKMAEQSIPKEAAYQIINDELMLDGNPRLNLASFVTTWMEPECDKLIMASINKNYVDMDEYPVTTELQASLISSAHSPLVSKYQTVNIINYLIKTRKL